MTIDCRRLAFLVLTLIVATRTPSAAQPAGAAPQPAPAQPAPAQPAPAQPAGTPPAAQPAPPPTTSATAERPPGPFAIDARIAMPSFNTGSSLADPLGLRTDQLPSRGWGYDVGAHVYPVHGRRFALGIGAEIIRASGSKAPDPEDTTAANDPTIETRFSALVPQVSLNFGSSRGWSFIGGGLAFMRRATGHVDADVADWPRLTGIHYGGGARWFMTPHVAFVFDLRFYRIPEQAADAAADVPFQPKSRLFLISAGLSFK